jgi:hypothetical protein
MVGSTDTRVPRRPTEMISLIRISNPQRSHHGRQSQSKPHSRAPQMRRCTHTHQPQTWPTNLVNSPLFHLAPCPALWVQLNKLARTNPQLATMVKSSQLHQRLQTKAISPLALVDLPVLPSIPALSPHRCHLGARGPARNSSNRVMAVTLALHGLGAASH